MQGALAVWRQGLAATSAASSTAAVSSTCGGVRNVLASSPQGRTVQQTAVEDLSDLSLSEAVKLRKASLAGPECMLPKCQAGAPCPSPEQPSSSTSTTAGILFGTDSVGLAKAVPRSLSETKQPTMDVLSTTLVLRGRTSDRNVPTTVRHR